NSSSPGRAPIRRSPRRSCSISRDCSRSPTNRARAAFNRNSLPSSKRRSVSTNTTSRNSSGCSKSTSKRTPDSRPQSARRATMTDGDAGRAIVLDVIGLEREHVASGLAPNIADLVTDGARADLQSPFPAVTLPVQSTLATGQSPANHGDVANGEYDRENDTAALWERDSESRDRLWES